MKKRGQKSEISGGVLVVLGLLIAASSVVVNIMTAQKFVIFIVAGGIIAVYGLFKISTRPKKNKELSLETMQKKYSKQQEVVQKQQQQMQKQMMEQLKQQQQMQAHQQQMQTQHQQMRQHSQQQQAQAGTQSQQQVNQQRPQPQHTRYQVRR